MRVLRDGKELADDAACRVTCLDTAVYMGKLLKHQNLPFEKGEVRVRTGWTEYIKNGGTLAEPENYITLK